MIYRTPIAAMMHVLWRMRAPPVAWRVQHNWSSRTVWLPSLGLSVVCRCAWWKRVWFLLRGL